MTAAASSPEQDIPRQHQFDVDLCREYLEFCGGKPPTAASMDEFKPTKFPLKSWQSFCGEPWSYNLHILSKAGCTDFSGLQQEVHSAFQEDGGGYRYSRRANYDDGDEEEDDGFARCLSKDSSLREIFQNHKTLRKYINRNICAARSIDPVKLIVADNEMRQVHVVRFDKENPKDEYSPEKEVVGELLIDCAFDDITKIYDPIFDETRWQMRLGNNNVDRNIRPLPDDGVTISELFDTLVEDNLLFKHTSYGREILSSILEAYEHYGRVQYRTEIGPEGFFFVDGKLQASKVKLRHDITKAEAVDAVNTIRDLQAKFYTKLVEHYRLAHVLKWAVQAPFDYAKRQLNLENNILPRIDLAGRPDTGKTYGYARLPLLIYGKSLNDTHLIGAGSVETAPRFIQKTSKTTFPVILDEVDFLVNAGRDDRVSHILSVIKNQCALTHPREILTKDGDVDSKPSFSPPMLTHNSDALQEEGGAKRFVPFVFTENDIKSKKEQEEYEIFITGKNKNGEQVGNGHLKELNTIGDFALSYVMKNPDVLRKPWVDTGKEILRALYALAEQKYPDWLDLVVANNSITDVGEHRRALIRATLLSEVNRAWSANRYGINATITTDVHGEQRIVHNPDPPLKDRIERLLLNDQLPTMVLYERDKVCLTTATVDLLKKGGVERLSLNQLVALTGLGKPDEQYKIKGHNTRGLYCTIDDFAAFLEH